MANSTIAPQSGPNQQSDNSGDELEIQIRQKTTRKSNTSPNNSSGQAGGEISIRKKTSRPNSSQTSNPQKSPDSTQSAVSTSTSGSSPAKKPIQPGVNTPSRNVAADNPTPAPRQTSTPTPRQAPTSPQSTPTSDPRSEPTSSAPENTPSKGSSGDSSSSPQQSTAQPGGLPDRKKSGESAKPSAEDRQQLGVANSPAANDGGIGRNLADGGASPKSQRGLNGLRNLPKNAANQLRYAIQRRPEDKSGNTESAPPGRGDLKDLENGTSGNEDPTENDGGGKIENDGKKTQRAKISDKSKGTESEEEKLDVNGEDKPSRFRGLLKAFSTRRRRILAGGGIVGAIIGLMFGFSVLQGPFQIIHFMQLLHGFHIGSQENAGDGRMGRLYRFVRAGGDPGETRISYLASKSHAKIISQLDSIGLKPEYGTLKTFKGFTIDTTNKASPYNGMKQSEIEARLTERGVPKEAITRNPDGSIFVDADKGYFKQTRALRAMVEDLHYSKVGTAVRVRVMAKYGLVTWHPMKKIDKAFNKKVVDLYKNWKEAREKEISRGEYSSRTDPTGATEEKIVGYDKEGNPIIERTPIGDPKIDPVTPSKATEILGQVRDAKSFKIAGGIATAAGIVCIVREVNNQYGEIRYAQVIAPLIRFATGVLTAGQQLMTGQDVDLDTLGFVSKSFNGASTNPGSSGKTTSAFYAKSILAEEGKKPAGSDADTDIAQGVKDSLLNGVPPWIAWANDSDPVIKAACSKAGSIVTGIVSTVVGVLSGGTLSTIASLGAGALAGPYVIDQLANFISGQSVNVAAVGAEFGTYANYGMRLTANTMSLMFGGAKLSAQDEQANKTAYLNDEQQNFNSQSVADKLLNPYERQSAISKLIDSSNPSVNQNMASLSSVLLGSKLLHFGSLFSKPALAASAYDYGFSAIGFSQSELNDPRYNDPYENADKAAALLDADPSLATKAHTCFGVDVTKAPADGETGPMVWGAKPSDKQADPYDPAYPSYCSDSTENWTRIRFFVFDTGIMESKECVEGDDLSCQNDGFAAGESPTDTATAQPTSPATTKIGSQGGDSDNIACAPGSVEILKQYTAHVNGTPHNVRLCKIPTIPCSNEECAGGYNIPIGPGKFAIVNSQVSAAWVALSKKAKAQGISLSTNSSFRAYENQGEICRAHEHHEQNGVCVSDTDLVASQGHSPHESGTAMDLNIPHSTGDSSNCSGRATQPDDPVWKFMKANAPALGIFQYSAESWHWDTNPAGLGNRCT